jgi:Mn-containing catalase
MHQNQWIAAIAELEADGLEMTPCPSNFPEERQKNEVAYQFIDASEGVDSADPGIVPGRKGPVQLRKAAGALGRHGRSLPNRSPRLRHAAPPVPAMAAEKQG